MTATRTNKKVSIRRHAEKPTKPQVNVRELKRENGRQNLVGYYQLFDTKENVDHYNPAITKMPNEIM